MIYGYKKKTKPANWTTTPAEAKRREDELAKDAALTVIRRHWNKKLVYTPPTEKRSALWTTMLGMNVKVVPQRILPKGVSAVAVATDDDGVVDLKKCVVVKRVGAKRIRRQSSTSRKASEGYRTKAALFVAAADQLGITCPVVALVPELRDGFKYGHPISSRITEVHHPYGRGHGGRGPLLMDERLWIGMARLGHRYVHQHPAWARANGFLAPVGQYNMPVPLDAIVVRLENGGIWVERNMKKEVDANAEIG